ncbi:hypothetical protein B0T25DRAFT_512714 [Lasiosphaeria hispida]|uniref:Uncharacterized protein n=1 Tax=Lasiosphaeria hispida TaxID=260671 RepID=A0AAJ0HTC0_9PEZI|nr:hypothetical protein B0T25DRAFT_512714 [Lasiosphaeria hispida]
MPPFRGRTFRLRGVPLHWSAGEVRSSLEVHYRLAAPIVKSLAPKIHGKSSTSTVTFESATSPGSTRRIRLPEPPKDRPFRDRLTMTSMTCPEVSVFWIHASSAERFRQAYASIAQECQAPGYNDPEIDMLILVKKWLEGKDCDRWLMVIDNADDTQVFFGQPAEPINTNTSCPDGSVGRYLPECAHGTILTTTRNKQTDLRLTQGKVPIEIGKMDEDESGQLLRISLNELLDKSNQNFVDLPSQEFETTRRHSGTPCAVAETWILSFEQIQQ